MNPSSIIVMFIGLALVGMIQLAFSMYTLGVIYGITPLVKVFSLRTKIVVWMTAITGATLLCIGVGPFCLIFMYHLIKWCNHLLPH